MPPHGQGILHGVSIYQSQQQAQLHQRPVQLWQLRQLLEAQALVAVAGEWPQLALPNLAGHVVAAGSMAAAAAQPALAVARAAQGVQPLVTPLMAAVLRWAALLPQQLLVAVAVAMLTSALEMAVA